MEPMEMEPMEPMEPIQLVQPESHLGSWDGANSGRAGRNPGGAALAGGAQRLSGALVDSRSSGKGRQT